MRCLLAICFLFLGPGWLCSQAVDGPKTQVSDAGSAPFISFSGFKWRVKTSRGGVGPGPNVFGAEGVEVDPHGRLHLAIQRVGNRWVCSEVILERSLGFGEYRFVVSDTAGIDMNAVFGLFLWDTAAPQRYFHEVDIEISRWGEQKPNAQFVVMPYQRPENMVRFELPPGRAELSFKWTPRQLLCRASVRGKIIKEHLFSKGISEPAQENVRLNAWLYRSVPPSDGKTVEVIVESFKFLPLDNKRR